MGLCLRRVDDLPRPPVIGSVDAFQRRHRWAGLPLAVVYKFVDDQGGYLTALITYYAFVSLFPLLLLLVTALGFALQGNPGLQQRVLDSALAQFPVIGDQIGTNIHSFHGSVLGLVTGILSSLYGGLGVVQATQNALNKMWGIPRNSRPNPITARLRSLLLLAAGGATILVTTVLSALTANAGAYGSSVRVGAIMVAIALNVALFTTQPAHPLHRQRPSHPRRPTRLHLLRRNGTPQRLRKRRRRLRAAPQPEPRLTPSTPCRLIGTWGVSGC
jgi:uncharacterized BrkB/YihY/UPF0761 family membrane protein